MRSPRSYDAGWTPASRIIGFLRAGPRSFTGELPGSGTAVLSEGDAVPAASPVSRWRQTRREDTSEELDSSYLDGILYGPRFPHESADSPE